MTTFWVVSFVVLRSAAVGFVSIGVRLPGHPPSIQDSCHAELHRKTPDPEQFCANRAGGPVADSRKCHPSHRGPPDSRSCSPPVLQPMTKYGTLSGYGYPFRQTASKCAS